MFAYLIFTIIGFVSGSILYAYWIPLIFCNKNVLTASSDGNPGTANAYKAGGFFTGTAVLIMELLKGLVPVYVASRYTDITSFFFIPIMIAPVLGHAAPFFDIQKGGKAIAVSFGVLLGIFPHVRPVLFLAATYIVFSLVLVVKPHLFRSILTFAVFFILTYLFTSAASIKISCFIISVIVILKHIKKYHGEKFSLSFLGLNLI